MNQPKIRMATKDDLPALIDLWAYCFNDGDIFQNWYFSKYYREEECIVVTVDGTVVASLQVIDLPTVVAGERLKAGYIVGVDCLPEYRGQGLTRMLMEEAISNYAREKNYALLHLMPFEADFYERYGFVYADYHAKMTLPIEEFYRDVYRDAAKEFHWKTVDLNNYAIALSELEHIYMRAMTSYDGYILRESTRRWSALLDDVRMENGHCKVLYNEENEACGYIVYLLNSDGLLVRELQAVGAKARQAIYYFIASHRSQVKQVKWSASENEPIVYTRKKDKLGVCLEPFMMALVLDPAAIAFFATQLPQETLYFKVENDGLYAWQAHSRAIHRIENDVDNAPTFTRGELTRLIFDRSCWNVCDADARCMQIQALFRGNKLFFNNEYF